ncbi:putative membrane protein [Aequorivita sublithincola DSM 14238]|uniref:Putative membrane protein n=1 Tax=Aequorivita sublithincola (strain DSM 14238 / LMG 21431 / ACAM 643 / 9-3) TaxID=746697 RepID=I3YUH3_AEQSU|nr:DMT family transporter [Aequorivita sublithincola]AFL80641.1 putative membrane protein [Aequorivita sublithincola DSM 14238]
MTKPRIALVIGIICISIFPILVKLKLSPPIISAFYRMAIASVVLVPFALFSGKLKIPSVKLLIITIICGCVFALDVAVWNIAIQESSATQATLLANLSPVWVGIGAFFFLRNKPTRNFWIGTIIAIFGMITLVGFHFFVNLDFNLAFIFAILSGIFYAIYLLISKFVLYDFDVLPFITLSTFTSAIFLGIISYFMNEPFTGFTETGWISLVVQGLICQLTAWLLVGYATKHMRATRVSVSLLGQAVLTTLFAWMFIGEDVTFQMIVGGIILLFGIRITFYSKKIPLIGKVIINSEITSKS